VRAALPLLIASLLGAGSCSRDSVELEMHADHNGTQVVLERGNLHVVMAVSVVAACILYRSSRELAEAKTARDAVPRPR